MLATLLQLFPGSQNWVLQKGLPATVCQNWALQKGLPPTVSQLGLAKGLKDDICHSRSFGWVLSRLCGWDAEPPCPSLLVLPAMHLQQGLDLEKKPPRSTCQCNVAAQVLPLPIALEGILFVQEGMVVLGPQKAKEIPHPSLRTSKWQKNWPCKRAEISLAKGLNLALQKGYTQMCFCQKGKKANWWEKPTTAAGAIGCMSHKPHTQTLLQFLFWPKCCLKALACGPCKKALVHCGPCKKAVAMSLMKPTRKRKKGAGNSAPPKRQPFPEVSQGLLDEKLQAYCRNMGIKEAMNFHEYKHLQAQQAENVRALVRLSRLLASLLFVSPEAKIKYCKQSLVVLQQDWGHELLSAHWPKTDHSYLPGKAADVIGVVLHHWRRVSKTEASWKRFCLKLDETEVDSMEALRKRMARNPDKHGSAAKTGRQLKAHVSDVTVDSDGYPKMLEEEVASSDGEVAGTSDGETSEGEGTAKEPPPQNLDQSALEESPPPCLKKKMERGGLQEACCYSDEAKAEETS